MAVTEPIQPPSAEGEELQPRRFTLRQRLALFFISTGCYWLIRAICCTLRYHVTSEVEGEDVAALPRSQGAIGSFWHRCVFMAAYFYRGYDMAVMTSASFDGEYIARIIQRFGFEPVRGSSSRGGSRALRAMHDVIRRRGVAAFTIDGPRGPRYVAKKGPVLLARNTGAPIRCFYFAPSKYCTLPTWDRFLIPMPLAKVHVRFAAPIYVPADTPDAQIESLRLEMQEALERVRLYAEAQAAGALRA